MTTVTSRQETLLSEGCPWADFNEMQLYMAVNDKLAEFGFAFGHGAFDRKKVEAAYLAPAESKLAAAITRTGRISCAYEVRVTPVLEALIAEALASPENLGSWDGYAWDVANMSTGACSWEFCAGERLFGCLVGGESRWLVTGLMDPGMWAAGEGWVTFGLAEEVLADPEVITSLSYDSVGEKAFGKDED